MSKSTSAWRPQGWFASSHGAVIPNEVPRRWQLSGQMLLAGFYFGLMNLVAERRTQRAPSSPKGAGA